MGEYGLNGYYGEMKRQKEAYFLQGYVIVRLTMKRSKNIMPGKERGFYGNGGD